LLVALSACSVDRSAPDAGGVHPQGWADPTSVAFHGQWLKDNSFPLHTCQECHGQDFAGGSVGVTCAQGGICHTQRPDTCTTCHGSQGTPRPATGAHWAHAPFCTTCHDVPTTARVELHASGDAGPIVQFSGLALADGGAPVWDPNAQRCSSAYCHFGQTTPPWTGTNSIACNACHEAPPANHAAWSRVASTTSSCTTCHPAPTSPTHVNGVVDVTVTSCTTCHGSDGHPNPPVSLDGSTDPTTPGVGAHDRHLDPAAPGRISEPLLCNDCHVVPSAVLSPGHLDQPTTVRFPFGGSFDPGTVSCNVWCHFNRTPGPVWTNDTGSARACDACHSFPPVTTRTGAPHPSVPADVSVCEQCHVFTRETHVNGVVDFVTP
jgi:predicted CxxxxCH...CXXCH cytochrome family protein